MDEDESSPPAERLPPHSVECEQGLLGCIMLQPALIASCIETLKTPQAFYDLRHQILFAVMMELFEDSIPIDPLIMLEYLRQRQQDDKIGGIAYIASLSDKTPSPENIKHYMDIVRGKYALRILLATFSGSVAYIYDHEQVKSAEELIAASDSAVRAATASVSEADSFRTIRSLVQITIAKFEEYHQHPNATDGIPTGFIDFDAMTGGLRPADVFILAGRPSTGKTSYAMNVAEHVAIAGRSVGVFSLEMTAESLVERMLCSRARVNARNVRKGIFSEREGIRLTAASAELSRTRLYIDDAAGLSIVQLRAKARRMYQQYALEMLVIDYLQLLYSNDRKNTNRQEEVAELSAGVKTIAKELKIPILLLSQLNREVEKDSHRKPRMADLRGSGAIEQDADIIGLLYKPDPNDDSHRCATATNLLIAKQRNGATGDIALTFFRDITRFESAASVQEPDSP